MRGLALVLLSVALLFMVQNASPVSVRFALWRFEGSLAIVLLLAFVGGGLTVWLLGLGDLFKKS